MKPIRVLELRSVRGTGGGPEKTILLGAARTDPRQFAITVCYIRDARDDVFGIDDKAAGLPVDYVEVRERHSMDPGVFPALRRIIRERQIDIVHAHEYKTDLLAWLLAKSDGIIPLATAHGWTGHSARERRLYYPADKKILARYPCVVAVSEDIRGELVRAGARPAAVKTILNGIDPLAFRRDRARSAHIRAALDLAPNDIVLGSVGRLEPQKRFDLLMDAAARLHRTHSRLKLLIVGAGSQESALVAHSQRLGLGPVCRMLGHRTDISDLHHAFDLYVQSSDYEGTPNSVLEAMALETPVVATAAGGTAQLVRDGVDGAIVPIGDLDALVATVDATLRAPATMAAYAAAARHRVETDLSFAARTAAIEAVYVELYQRYGRAHADAAAVSV